MNRAAVLLVLSLLLALPDAWACTTFCLKKGPAALFGKNYDWHFGDGLVVVNKRGVEKTAALPAQEKPARWTSRYGSITFKQYGREFPNGGLNEAGLAVELMWLDGTRYPKLGEAPALGGLEWIQYQLDNYATAAEVAKNAGALRIVSGAAIHFLACDKSGNCAAVEFLDGKPVVHTGASLPARALANHSYEDSLRFRDRSRGDAEAVRGQGSLQRFSRAAGRSEEFAARGAADPVGYAFATLADVAQGSYTQWSIVYDLKAGRVHWRTRENPQIRSVALSAFDFSCGQPVEILEIHQGKGDVARAFTRYTPEANRRLIQGSYEKVRSQVEVRPEELAATLAQPERTRCAVR
jgi:penicillin V acylase-like amidase (Ntn superfamily)